MTKEVDLKQAFKVPLVGRAAKNFKRMKTWEALAKVGINPAEQLFRLAYLSEAAEDYSTAAGIWKDLLSYVEPRMKPINPAEEAERGQRQITMVELQNIKKAILAGEVTAITDESIIDEVPDAELVEDNDEVDELW